MCSAAAASRCVVATSIQAMTNFPLTCMHVTFNPDPTLTTNVIGSVHSQHFHSSCAMPPPPRALRRKGTWVCFACTRYMTRPRPNPLSNNRCADPVSPVLPHQCTENSIYLIVFVVFIQTSAWSTQLFSPCRHVLPWNNLFTCMHHRPSQVRRMRPER